MNINELSKEAHENAVAHGFWEEERPFAELIALMHSELSEALEEYRDGHGMQEVYWPLPFDKPEGIPIELADVIIRICDTCGKYRIDLEKAIQLKMKYNKTRPYKHGKKI